MLFLLFGASGAGKTSALTELRGRVPRLAVHDLDEIGVPPHPDTTWRHGAIETWVRRALDYQAREVDLLLGGQAPLGEVLAAPSAPLLERVSACLLDCADKARLARLRARGPVDLQAQLNWADWMRRHASDPSWRQDVIQQAGAAGMRWERWSDWQPGHERWRVRRIDTTNLAPALVAEELAAWIAEERALLGAR